METSPPITPPPSGPTPPPSGGAGRNPLALVVVAVLVAGMLYFGLHMAKRPRPHLTQATLAPDFTLESLDGKSTRLSDLRGKAVLLNFWAPWCEPCKIETPWLVEFQNQYGSQGLRVVGVALEYQDKDEVAKFVKQMGVGYTVLLGKDETGDEYGGVPGLPETFFIGRDGKIVDKIMGLRGKGDIEEDIKRTLDTGQDAQHASAADGAVQPQNKQ